jgi:serine protease Do/serine protease DegQ
MTGALVNQVLPDGPAEKAGVRRGDVLLTLDGREIRGVRALQLLVASTPAGKTVDLEVLRNGKRQALPVTIVASETVETAAVPSAVGKGVGLGLVVAPADEGGVRVEEVDPRSAAAAAGVRPGDRILSLNQKEVEDLASFNKAAKIAGKGKNVVLLLRRGDTTLYLAFPAS